MTVSVCANVLKCVCGAIGFGSAGNSTKVLCGNGTVSALSTIRVESLWRFRLQKLTASYNKVWHCTCLVFEVLGEDTQCATVYPEA